jgi:prophage regulatory protein
MAERFLPLREVLELTSLSRSQIYRLISRGTFPDSIALGGRVAWLESEVHAWIYDRVQEHLLRMQAKTNAERAAA